MLPDFAKPIAEARRKGMKPDRMVIIAYGISGLHRDFPNPVVRVRPTDDPRRFDWSWLIGLDVEIATTRADRGVVDLVDAILPSQPRSLRVWNPDTDRSTRVMWDGQIDIRNEDACVAYIQRNFPYRSGGA